MVTGLILVIILMFLPLSSINAREDIRRCKTNTQLIKTIYVASKKLEAQTGIPALFPVAQTVEESSWDVKPLVINGKQSWNIYGIKWHYGDKFVETTGSDSAKYQVYNSLEDCFRDHSQILLSDIKGKNAIYTYKQSLELYKQDHNLRDYIHNVALSYATAELNHEAYTNSIMDIMDILKKTLGVKMTQYEQETKDAEELMTKLGLITQFGQPLTDVRLAVIIARLLKQLKSRG